MDRAQSRVFLVDITIPYDENLVRAETEKKRKYLDPAHEVTAMWHVTAPWSPTTQMHGQRATCRRKCSMPCDCCPVNRRWFPLMGSCLFRQL
ncbi:jg14825 [Pararge aegeria aegeria]|uniref:Jg14825 protein n=1 Tax=Pararge aegeria aegeria TaxID=348720 RepID=A0A8S4RKE5_9NEOP|nr:jg14825 [Pararge aegeria aegeria]